MRKGGVLGADEFEKADIVLSDLLVGFVDQRVLFSKCFIIIRLGSTGLNLVGQLMGLCSQGLAEARVHSVNEERDKFRVLDLFWETSEDATGCEHVDEPLVHWLTILLHCLDLLGLVQCPVGTETVLVKGVEEIVQR